MDIDELVARFAALPGAAVGAGPRHPVDPDPTLAPRITGFLDAYPQLNRDAGYVEFLWKYAGLARRGDDDRQLFDVFGFSPVTADIVADFDADVVDEEGFLYFAEAIRHGGTPDRPATLAHGFAFNLAPDREWAVYRVVSVDEDRVEPYAPYLDSFTSFLAEVAANGGVYEPPAVP